MNELSKYKYVANDFNDLCNIIGNWEYPKVCVNLQTDVR